MTSEAPEGWAALARDAGFAVMGLGGAGSEVVHDLVGLGLPGVRALSVNTDARQLLRYDAEERILIGQRTMRGRGSAGDRRSVLDAVEEVRDELLGKLRPYEIVFLLAGLGGGTGSALLPYLTELIGETETVAIPIVFLPFHVELDSNPERRANVETTLSELERQGGLLLPLANEKLRRFENLPLHRVFHVRSAYVHSLVVSLVDMVENPSQLNVDLASLKSHLREGGLSTLLHGEYHISEPDRLVQQALTETLLDFELDPSPSALVHVDGGSNLTLRTFNRVIHALRTRLGEPRRLVFGTRTHPEPREVVRMTAVVGGVRSRSVRAALGTRSPSAPPPLLP